MQLQVGTDRSKVAVGKLHFKLFSLSYWENAPTIMIGICLFYEGEQVVGPNQNTSCNCNQGAFQILFYFKNFISVLGTS
jgi:hypothetical protein